MGPEAHVLEWCILSSSECLGEPCPEDPSAYKQEETWYKVETLLGLTIPTPGVRKPHSSLHCPGEAPRAALFQQQDGMRGTCKQAFLQLLVSGATTSSCWHLIKHLEAIQVLVIPCFYLKFLI